MKTILIATDFSATAENAANYASEMALTINANVLLLHVCHIPVSYNEIPVVVTPADLVHGAEINLDNLKQRLINHTNRKLKIETEVRMGGFFGELETVCQRVKPYSVIMGSQGMAAAERLFFGSHTLYALKHLVWPLITVPPQAKFSSVKKIGLACDLNKVVDTTPVGEMKTLVNDFHAELHVLNTGKKEVYNPELVFESGLLQKMQADLKPQYHFITSENTDDGIMDFAEKNHIDLLIVLPKRHGLLQKLLHRSHSKQLVLHSHVPVMALH